jgi:hypothetical protein
MGIPLGDSTTAPLVGIAGLSASGTPSSATFLRGDNTWAAATGTSGGSVTSIALSDGTGLFTIIGSPITTSGTITLNAFASQSVNTVLAGPASGGSGPAAFRTLVAADVPVLSSLRGATTNAQSPQGLSNRSTTTQSTGQLSASTPVYITNSNINLPASLVTGIVTGTVLQWRFNVGKNANGTGACSILLYYGTHGSTADTAYVTATLPASTAVIDTMTVDIQVTFTSATACSYVMGLSHTAATGTGFGVVSGTPALSGTATGMTTSTGSLIFGVGIEAATGGTLPTYIIGFVQGEAYNLV